MSARPSVGLGECSFSEPCRVPSLSCTMLIVQRVSIDRCTFGVNLQQAPAWCRCPQNLRTERADGRETDVARRQALPTPHGNQCSARQTRRRIAIPRSSAGERFAEAARRLERSGAKKAGSRADRLSRATPAPWDRSRSTISSAPCARTMTSCGHSRQRRAPSGMEAGIATAVATALSPEATRAFLRRLLRGICTHWTSARPPGPAGLGKVAIS